MSETAGRIFDLDAVEAEATAEPFAFTYKGRDWKLTPFEQLDKSLLDQLTKPGGSPEAVVLEAFQQAFGEQWDDFDAMPMPLMTLNALLEQWAKSSGLSLGEGVAFTRS